MRGPIFLQCPTGQPRRTGLWTWMPGVQLASTPQTFKEVSRGAHARRRRCPEGEKGPGTLRELSAQWQGKP